MSAFIDALFLAKENVNEAKRKFGDKIKLDYIERDFEKNLVNYKINIDNVDKYLSIKYTKNSLAEAIKAIDESK